MGILCREMLSLRAPHLSLNLNLNFNPQYIVHSVFESLFFPLSFRLFVLTTLFTVYCCDGLWFVFLAPNRYSVRCLLFLTLPLIVCFLYFEWSYFCSVLLSVSYPLIF